MSSENCCSHMVITIEKHVRVIKDYGDFYDTFAKIILCRTMWLRFLPWNKNSSPTRFDAEVTTELIKLC